MIWSRDCVKVGFQRNQKYYSQRYEEASFTLYQKYTYEDVCQLMEWETSIVPLNIGGYKYDEATKHIRYLSIMIRAKILQILLDTKINYYLHNN